MRESEGRGVNFRNPANDRTEEAKDQQCPNSPLLVTGYIVWVVERFVMQIVVPS